MSSDAKILIVEDEEQLLRMLRSTLIQAGYAVTTAKTGAEALEQLVLEEFGVVLLDLGLPDIDGKEVISQARAISKAPILVISARGSEREKIAALDLGASDYVPKPFDVGELLARIRVALRPPRRCAASESGVSKKGLQIDMATRRAIVDGEYVRLSRKEAELLQLLADAKGEIVSHDQIIEAIWGRAGDADFMNVRVLAWQVRRKIEPDAAAPRFLLAESGLGYRLNMT
ncbi:response regulator transcription factor [Phenylobacterium sp. LH3H17]|uniref:response regulator transcription factor n=1 Tax=Phenylobacterium sp. LH3H17 TaxID=2903901 RepID=UPI0020C9C4D3|nr:response regulator transcription factor [Phenylobacterium sp. LH3H17]UTP38812.1 response regulator transcription factor [Phenylobacterium sp. LH3H17]